MKTLKNVMLIMVLMVTMVATTKLVSEKVEANKEIATTKKIVNEIVKGEHEEYKILAYTVREDGKINTLSKYDDKIVITQDIEGDSYVLELDINHNNIENSVLMYMCNYHAFNNNVTTLILI